MESLPICRQHALGLDMLSQDHASWEGKVVTAKHTENQAEPLIANGPHSLGTKAEGSGPEITKYGILHM